MALFEKSMGITLIDSLMQLRVSHAQRLLATTDEKIIEVAFASGLGSLSRLHEAFKEWCECSPKAYRKNTGSASSAPAEWLIGPRRSSAKTEGEGWGEDDR